MPRQRKNAAGTPNTIEVAKSLIQKDVLEVSTEPRIKKTLAARSYSPESHKVQNCSILIISAYIWRVGAAGLSVLRDGCLMTPLPLGISHFKRHAV